jgi:pyruvate/2-oxoglutarate dehydrogenase complex dihydrolipoamide acyltransferase (E2) component
MATPINVPRINNNDDEVKVLEFEVTLGQRVAKDQIVGQVETDKAALDVTAPTDGYVLGFVPKPEEIVKVGSILLWLGETPDEAIPEEPKSSPAGTAAPAGTTALSAKARLLAKKHGLTLESITPIDGRITVEAIEKHLAATGQSTLSASAKPGAPTPAESTPDIPGTAVVLTREEKGMLATVTWHRDYPVTGYIEIDYDLAPWAAYAKKLQEAKGWMMSPLLPLMAWRLVEIAKASPRLNATIVAGKRFEYSQVNLGFTIQAGDALYLAVVRDAANLDEAGFVNALGELQRRAVSHSLKETEASGATIGFSSMERWKVTRHIPVLPPHTTLMIAHAATRGDKGVIGATYDHRVLNGAQVVAALRQLASPKAA